ncbi:MAG TPA: superoxide dismutase family protein, partial [Myxococcota bacterium]|nr:superoxide dismutase family protein [Myxococcota bacterium]
FAAEMTVNMYTTVDKGKGEPVGTVTIKETEYGLLFTPDLKKLGEGAHGFHVHENPSCAQSGMAAGGHLDPKKTNKHLGPYDNNGHLGDLPFLFVEKDGTAKAPVLAPRLKNLSEIKNHSLMIHEGGDNYSDKPSMGGGGKRMWCGVM